MAVISAGVFKPRLTAPDVVAAVRGLVAVTLDSAPGKVCVGAKVMTPFPAMVRTLALAVPF